MQKQVFRIIHIAKIRGFGASRKGIENEKPKGSQNDSKIKLWAPRAQIFEFLGGCSRGQILMNL